MLHMCEIYDSNAGDANSGMIFASNVCVCVSCMRVESSGHTNTVITGLLVIVLTYSVRSDVNLLKSLFDNFLMLLYLKSL